MEVWLLSLIIFSSLVLLLCLGVPISFSLCGLSTIGIIFTWGPKGLLLLFNAAYAESTSFLLLAIPLFIFMANQLKFSGIGDDLYEMVYRWMGRIRGGLALGTVAICAIFAAMAGISSVATISMGLIALPSMLSRGYQKDLAIGSIAAGGALGILIPPSIIMILYGAMAEVSVGKMFVAGIIPGFLMCLIFMVYIAIRSLLNKNIAPAIEDQFTFKEKLVVLKGVILPIALVFLVLGVIYFGVCTPTEASAVGAFGAMGCALFYGKLTWANLKASLFATMKVNAMVFWLIIGALAFTNFLAYSEIQDLIKDSILSLEYSRWVILIAMQLIFFVLGMFLDPAGIIMLTTPIFVPIIVELGFDPLWFGILFVINMEMAYITPPFGFNLFILKGIVPSGITMVHIYRAIIPFVFLQALCLILVMLWPQLATWLPDLMITR
ncbi:MAG: TRAP transporter large permease subunit [Proteobacteria bacterium]|nr:TRAP transporter large permease subunit [Pseudomonadota bacterium]MBU1388993.1 TRAP transporter large permease subunit [Pseudomonadota bacterium]MBU1543545.1 TRAP transporter large permease subunit [Pseudomonadota bacterium]MBU2429153.1 TRAP transporter large permease subunit [Pseudomonadota bacterium]MBU2480653.1 TRAP transporter large permease subunit [Pseudomonadota bacterium]